MIRESTLKKHIGRKFFRMTVVRFSRKDPKNTHHYFYVCKCDCGVEKEARLSNLQQGSVRSCGCLAKESQLRTHKGNTYRSLGYGENALNRLFDRYAHDAKKRGLSFDLSMERFKELTSSNCYFCGATPSSTAACKNAFGEYRYNGIDRVDNSFGYAEKNCVPCCVSCNAKKNAIPKEMVEKLYFLLFGSPTDRRIAAC